MQCIQCSKGICKVVWVGVSQLLLGPGRSIHKPATLCTVLAWEFRYKHFCRILFIKGFWYKEKRESILESKNQKYVTKRCLYKNILFIHFLMLVLINTGIWFWNDLNINEKYSKRINSGSYVFLSFNYNNKTMLILHIVRLNIMYTVVNCDPVRIQQPLLKLLT